MKKRHTVTLSLRRWLFVMSFAAMLPLMLFSTYVVLDVQRQLRNQVLEDLRSRTASVAHRMQVRVDEAVVLLATLGASDAAQRSDWAALYWDAKRAVAVSKGVRGVTLVNAQGQVLFYTGMRYGDAQFKANQPEMIQEVFQSGRPNVSGVFNSPLSSKTLVAVSVPLLQGGQVTYVMRAIILTDTINEMLTNSGLPNTWVAGVVDRKGILLARNHHPEEFIGKMASSSFLEQIRQASTNPMEGTTLEGESTTSLALPVFGGDWFVGVGVPTKVLNAPMNIAILALVLLGILWMTLSLFISQRFATYLSKQAQILATAVSGASIGAESTTTVHEFNKLIQEIVTVKQLQHETSGRLTDAIDQREEVKDLYNNAPCGYHSLDSESRIVQINDTELHWLGYTRDEVVGHRYTEFVAEQSRAVFAKYFPQFLRQGYINDVELELMRKDGTTLFVALNATSVREDGVHLMSRSTVFNITERKKLESELIKLARIDPLTGMSNRRDFYEKAQHEMARAKRFHTPLAVLALDIDHFKQVNDTHGHDGGDAVLQGISRIVGDVLRDVDITARFGGEEFVAMMPGTDIHAATEAAERLREAIAKSQVALPSDVLVHITASIGVAALEDGDAEVDQMLKRADLGVYAAKKEGRNQVRIST